MVLMKSSLQSARTASLQGCTWVAEFVRSAPGTFIYFFALLVTSWSLQGLNPRLADQLVQFQSTNLDNLTDRPVQVLVLSAFWTTGGGAAWLLLRFAFVMAPVERRLGTRRWLVIFASAHVLATLVTVTGISLGIGRGAADPGLLDVIDVGVSYGLYGVVGALTWLLASSRLRIAWVLAALASIVLSGLGDEAFTNVGHLLSISIGLAFFPLIRRWQLRPSPHAILGGRAIVVPHLSGLRQRDHSGAEPALQDAART